MNQQYPNGYPNHQNSQQPLTPSFRPPPNSLPPPSPHGTLPQPTSHNVPRITPGGYVPSYGTDSFVPRSQSLQQSSSVSHIGPASQPFSNVYGPTANFFTEPLQNFGHSPQTHASLQNGHLPQPQSSLQNSRPPSTSAPSQSHPQAAYISTLAQGPLRDLAPAPPQGGGPLFDLGNADNPAQAEDESQPVHVVGSQGRRGILPSAAGHPPAMLGTSKNGQKGAPAPSKNSDGKYPCPHCTKTYLHAKHLKRHLLRREYMVHVVPLPVSEANEEADTGDRPYMCILCKDNFTRSDILKRHFIKCSQRRGNPTNADHLSHARAQRKAQQTARIRGGRSSTGTTPPRADASEKLTSYTPTSADASVDIGALNLNQAHYNDSSNQVSRASSVKNSNGRPGNSSNRTSMGLINTSGFEAGPGNYPRSGHVTPDSAGTESGAVTPFHYPHESRSNPLSPNGTVPNAIYNIPSASMPPGSSYTNGSFPHIHTGQDQHDWHQFASRFYQNDEYGHQMYHSGTNTPLQRIKSDTDISSFPLHGIGPYINKPPGSSRP